MYTHMVIPLRETGAVRTFGQHSHHSSLQDAEQAIQDTFLHGLNPNSRGWIVVDNYGYVFRYNSMARQMKVNGG